MFNKEEIFDEKTKEMILAYYLYETISRETEIFGNKRKNGELISKLSSIEKDKDIYGTWKEGLFQNVQAIVQNSIIFNKTTKSYFESKEIFLENKKNVISKIQSYQFFSMGKYLTLAIFKFVLDKCNYLDILFGNNLFS